MSCAPTGRPAESSQIRIEPLRRFAAKLTPQVPGHPRPLPLPLGGHLVAGINNMFKVIKRMAYGVRDGAYLFLKIRAAFPDVG